jgi:hypothetical protein
VIRGTCRFLFRAWVLLQVSKNCVWLWLPKVWAQAWAWAKPKPSHRAGPRVWLGPSLGFQAQVRPSTSLATHPGVHRTRHVPPARSIKLCLQPYSSSHVITSTSLQSDGVLLMLVNPSPRALVSLMLLVSVAILSQFFCGVRAKGLLSCSARRAGKYHGSTDGSVMGVCWTQ